MNSCVTWETSTTETYQGSTDTSFLFVNQLCEAMEAQTPSDTQHKCFQGGKKLSQKSLKTMLHFAFD